MVNTFCLQRTEETGVFSKTYPFFSNNLVTMAKKENCFYLIFATIFENHLKQKANIFE